MEAQQLKPIVESLIFTSEDPLTAAQLKRLVNSKKPNRSDDEQADEPEEQADNQEAHLVASAAEQLKQRQEDLADEISITEIKTCIKEIIAEYQDSSAKGIEVVEVAKGYQFRTKSVMAPYLKRLTKLPKPKLSAPGMECLAIVAYQQPLTRAKVEEIRGVDSGGVLKTLLEKDLVRVVGRSEEVGRPILYGTTKTFLETFSLKSLSDLPTLKDLNSLDDSNQRFESSEGEAQTDFIQEAEDDSLEISDEGDAELIGELENSMRGLKDLEKKIFEKKQPDEPSTDPQVESKDPQ